MTIDERIEEATELRNSRHLTAENERRERTQKALETINDAYQREINQAESDWQEVLRECRESEEHRQAVQDVKTMRAAGELPEV